MIDCSKVAINFTRFRIGSSSQKIVRILIIELIIVCILGACVPATLHTPTDTAFPSQTSIPPSSTPTWWMTPVITATPLNLILNEKDEIRLLIEQLHPSICTGYNLAILTPPSIEVPPPTTLEITEVVIFPDQYTHYVSAIADNIDNSLQAYIACEPEKCVDSVYVKDNDSGRVYKVYFGNIEYRPLQWLHWINKDTFIVAQSSNPHYGLFVAINFNKREYVYYGMAMECWDTPTPTQ